MRIEEAAVKKQAQIDSGEQPIIGVNCFKPASSFDFETLEVQNAEVLAAQVERLESLRATRNAADVSDALQQLTEACQSNGNLLEAAVKAARARATLGEISMAMEKVFDRYVPQTVSISGVYSGMMSDQDAYKQVREKTDKFEQQQGRRPRILVAKLGQDGHDRGAKVIATSFADLGFDVDIGPLFQTPEEAAKQAMENDVHILGISSLAAGHKTLVPEVVKALKALDCQHILVVVGGVIPTRDYDFLFEAGVAGVFGPGTVITDAANELMDIIL